MESKLSVASIKKELKKAGSPQKAKDSARFFKTGLGEYGAGDVFVGVSVPEQRKIAGKYKNLSLQEVEELLHSPEHEFRVTALIILVNKWKVSELSEREKIHKLYLYNTKWINNWDLVDTSASYCVGQYLQGKNKALLSRLAKSKGESADALKIADILLLDDHDLIQKAVGWMLREVGKRCGQDILENFLASRYKKMPRTALRYAIERLPEGTRKAYLAGTV